MSLFFDAFALVLKLYMDTLIGGYFHIAYVVNMWLLSDVLIIGWFHVNEGQPCHPYSQILIKFSSNVPTYKKQK